MFDIGFWEFLLVAIVLLLVVGPQQIPRVAFTIGKWVQYLRNSFNAVSSDMKQQIDAQYRDEYQRKEMAKHQETNHE